MREAIYYVDESGDLDMDGSNIFILGCVIVNDIDIINQKIIHLKKEIKDSIVLNGHKMENGFHACENHPEIYQEYIKLLFTLDFRAYILVLDKKSEYFSELVQNSNREEIYNKLVFHLLYGRLLKRKTRKNLIMFEQQSNKIQKEKIEKEKIILSINNILKKEHLINNDINFIVRIIGKQDQVISLIDYVLHIFGRIYQNNEVNFWRRNFELIEPKIGLVFDIANDKYYKLRNLIKTF